MAVDKVFFDAIEIAHTSGEIERLENFISTYSRYLSLIKAEEIIDFSQATLAEWGLDIDLNNIVSLENYICDVLKKAIEYSKGDIKIGFSKLLRVFQFNLNKYVLLDIEFNVEAGTVKIKNETFDFRPKSTVIVFDILYRNKDKDLTLDEIAKIYYEDNAIDYGGDKDDKGKRDNIKQIIARLKSDLKLHGLSTMIKILIKDSREEKIKKLKKASTYRMVFLSEQEF